MIKIDKHNREFNLLKWVLSAAAQETSRYAINGVNFAGNKACCTDGRRLHIGTFLLNEFEEGTFEIITNTAKLIVLGEKIDGNFPNYDDIVPVTDLKTLDMTEDDYLKQLVDGVPEEDKVEFLAKRCKKIATTDNLYKMLKVLFSHDITLSIPFMLDVLQTKKLNYLDASGDTWDVIASTPNRPVQFSNETKTAVVMSITMV